MPFAGGIAPFSLEGYENAKRWHRMVAYMAGEGLMPPWRAVPGFGEFRDARRLSDHQIALLRAWSESGASLGDPEDRMPAPPRTRSKWRLGEPDLVLRMPEPFDVPADGDDIYRYFVVPTGWSEDKVVVALDFSPGDPKVVHHSNYLLDFAGRARAEDAKDDEPGFSVFGTGGFLDYNAWGIGGWTPGADPYVLDEGLGMWLPGGGDLVLEVHYHLNGKATSDQSEVAFYFAKEPVTEYVDGVVIGTQDLEIPPEDGNYWRHFSMNVPSGMRLTDVTPHMHFLGREFISIATLPDGSERPLIRIADWDFPVAEHLHLPGAGPPAGGEQDRHLGAIRQLRGQPPEPGARAPYRDLGVGDHRRDERAVDRLHPRLARGSGAYRERLGAFLVPARTRERCRNCPASLAHREPGLSARSRELIAPNTAPAG